MTGRIVYQEIDMTIVADATQDLWSVMAGSGNRVTLHGWELTSIATSAVIMEIVLHRITAVGSGGTGSSNEELADEEFGPITASVRTEDTTPGADGGFLQRYQWEQLGPVGHVYTPEMRPITQVSQGFALTCNTAIVATLAGYICYEE